MGNFDDLADFRRQFLGVVQNVADLVVKVSGLGSQLDGRRVIGGSVDATTGALTRGVGFTGSKVGTGLYLVTFSATLTELPTPAFGLFSNGLLMGINCYASSLTTMNVSTYRTDTGAAVDCAFSFWFPGL